MKIFIWESGGISEAYHDDGTLVVLANTDEEARQIMLDNREKGIQKYLKKHPDEDREEAIKWSNSSYGWDGELESIDKPPSQIIEIDEPKFIVFNGGGYD